MLADNLSEEEIENGLQLTLFFLRHPPRLDGGSMRTIVSASMTVGFARKPRGMDGGVDCSLC